jgi:phospholipid/cholesterol/gamma-HCH transport system substrate-binding protein
VSPSPLKRLRRRRTGRRRGTPALVIAVVVILVPVLIVYYAFTHKLPFLTNNYTDYAIVSNSVNVRPGSPVRVAGIDVGTVSHVSADGDATKIAFNVSAQARPIHTDATIAIRDRLFLEGSYYLDLEPGSPSAPVAQEGFTVRQNHTSSPVQFFQLLSVFDSAARASLAHLLKTTNVAFSPPPGQPESDSGAGALKQAIPELTPDLKDFALISQSLTGTHAGDVETFLSSTAQLTGTLAAHREHLADLFVKLDTVAGTLSGEDQAISATINGVDATLRTTPRALTAINRSLTPTDHLAAALTPTLKQSPQLVSQLTQQLRAVDNVIKPGQRQLLIGSLHTLLVDFPTILAQTADFFPATKPAADCLAEKVVPLLNEQVQDGSLSTHVPVWKDLVHMLPNLAAASGNFDSNGPYLRALLGVGSASLPTSLLGSLPGAGQLVGTVSNTLSNTLSSVTGGTTTADSSTAASSSGTDSVTTAPTWVGDLTAADFRPDVLCSTQPLPTNLVSNPAEADQ